MSDLEMLFDYTPDDLVANRGGCLSVRQQQIIARALHVVRVEKRSAWFSYLMIGLATVAYFAFMPAFGSRLGPNIWLGVVAWFGLWAVLICAVYFGARWVLWRTLTAPVLYDNPVIARAGRLTVRSDGEHDYLFLNEDELQTNVDARQDKRLWRLTPDQDYVLYFFRERVVAVETTINRIT